MSAVILQPPPLQHQRLQQPQPPPFKSQIMATNNKLKAYVRFDGTGRVIAGSLILQRFKPKVGNWKEIDANECCITTTSTSSTTTTTTTVAPTTTTTTTT